MEMKNLASFSRLDNFDLSILSHKERKCIVVSLMGKYQE